ncbi:MAG: hypothetical protein SFW67_25300 [Myxococcaceae bacterium]|nr:hypothetical protein [Myxococcaceae bacterium]
MGRAGMVVFLAGALRAFAQPAVVERASDDEPEQVTALPCRPTIACTADIVPAGFVEVEAGYGGRSSAGQLVHSGQLLLKLSAHERLQFQLATNNLFLLGAGLAPRSVDGVIPGVKVKFNDQGTFLPANAVSVHASLPTHGFEDSAQRTIDAAAWWYLSKDVGPIHADLNFALNVFDLTRAPTPQGLTALALSTTIAWGFGVMTEVYSTFGNAQAVPLDGGWLNAISYAPVDEIMFDVGADVGFYWQTRVVTFFAGVTFVPHRKARMPLTRAPSTTPVAQAVAR